MTATTEAPTARPLSSRTTPSGMVIEYWEKPRRHYKIDGVEVVSVTTALDVLGKDALPWWGMKVGVLGLHALLGMGVVRPANDPETGRWLLASVQDGRWQEATIDHLVGDSVKGIKGLLTQHQLTVNHVKESGGKRGQSAHDALEAWGVTGEMPKPEEHTFEEQPYVQALLDFLQKINFEVEAQEVVVGSKEHGFAGRYDVVGTLRTETTVVTKVFPKAKPKHVLLSPGKYRLDLKTSKDVYVNHLLQLEAYELASIECGDGATDYRLVIQCGADGRYQARLVKPEITGLDYVQIVKTYEVLKRAEEALKV